MIATIQTSTAEVGAGQYDKGLRGTSCWSGKAQCTATIR